MKRRPCVAPTPRTLAIALAAVLGACASKPPAVPAEGPGTEGPAGVTGPRYRALEQRARAESDSPVKRSQSLPPPPGLDPRLVEPISRADPDSPTLLGLAPTLERLSRAELVEPDITPPARPDLGARVGALRLYASGRSKLLEGDLGPAILDLESATRLDPTSGEAFRELGEAQMQQGKRLAAMGSFRQAVKRGLREPRTLWFLGRDAQRAGRAADAVPFLAAARDADPEETDATLPFLIDADLADALSALQRYGAAAEALDSALDFPDQFSTATHFRLEFAELLRRRGDMLRDLGDLYCRLERYDDAADAYARASRSPSLDQGAAIPRLVHVSLKRGHPSEAALTLVEHVRRSSGLADERTIALVRFLAANTGAGPALADALAELRSSRAVAITPSVAGALARAQAAALDRERGASVLRAHLAEHPDDGAAMADLVAPDEGAALATELTRLLRRAPAGLDACADAALSRPGSADPLLAELAEDGGDEAVALRATILAKLGMRREAADLVVKRPWSGRFESAGPACEATLAGACGRYDDARRAYDALRAVRPPDPRSLSQAALAMQRADDAADILRAAVTDPAVPDSGRIELLVTGATLCTTLGRPDEAERYLRRAVAADPHDERAYAGFLRLYSPGGPLADQAKLADTIRAVRDATPAARVLRLAAAQELIERRLDTQAEQLLTGLVDDDLTDAASGLLLVSIWDKRGTPASPGTIARPSDPAALARAESWLRARVDTHPEVHWLWSALARVLWAKGDPGAGEALLADRLRTRPVDDLAKAREAILREGLSRRDEADAAALARLQPEPRTISASVELVDLLVRTDHRAEALEALRRSIPRTITLTDDQQASLGIMLARTVSRVSDKPALADATTVALFDEVADRKVRLPQQLHDVRLAILTSRVNDDPDAVRRAVDLAVAQHPSLAPSFYTQAAAGYINADKPKNALPYLHLYAESTQTPSTEMLFHAFRLTVTDGERPDVEWLIGHVTQLSDIEAVCRRAFSGTPIPIPSDPAKARAEFAYRLATVLLSRKRSDLAFDAYRAALGFDPDHAMVMNDWGYEILDTGGDLAQAESLIEGAYERQPNDASIIDSLAWVRYHRGVLTDDPGPPAREGAVTLLRKAAATDKGADDATILSHLGDASWAAGLKDEALAAWRKAVNVGSVTLAEIKRQRDASPDLTTRVNAELEATRARIKAAEHGEDPPIVKQRGT